LLFFGLQLALFGLTFEALLIEYDVLLPLSLSDDRLEILPLSAPVTKQTTLAAMTLSEIEPNILNKDLEMTNTKLN